MDQPMDMLSPKHIVCQLRKVVYGLKQSPCAWFDRFNTIVLGYGFHHSNYAHSVFVHHSITCIIVLIVYVNDIIIFSNDSIGIPDLKSYSSQQFHTKDLDALSSLLSWD